MLRQHNAVYQSNKKCDLFGFNHGIVVGDRRPGLGISETADILRISHTRRRIVSRKEGGKVSAK